MHLLFYKGSWVVFPKTYISFRSLNSRHIWNILRRQAVEVRGIVSEHFSDCSSWYQSSKAHFVRFQSFKETLAWSNIPFSLKYFKPLVTNWPLKNQYLAVGHWWFRILISVIFLFVLLFLFVKLEKSDTRNIANSHLFYFIINSFSYFWCIYITSVIDEKF